MIVTEIGVLDRLVNDKPKARKTLSHYLIKIGACYRIDNPSDLIGQIAPALALTPATDDVQRLICDVEDSMRNDVLARSYGEHWSAELRAKIAEAGARDFLEYLQNLPPHLRAIALDQLGALEGHPFYPTWKAKIRPAAPGRR